MRIGTDGPRFVPPGPPPPRPPEPIKTAQEARKSSGVVVRSGAPSTDSARGQTQPQATSIDVRV
ncbi:MAG TPA: hypothetical protein VFC93_05325 [Chloroflexota bacterium]|jgi:hypothetical protein|nr:hypothetical protein [Chloroflexota bacterium]